MKYLSDYVQDAQTAIFEKYGVFFAFNNQQFAEKKQEGVKYVSVGMGMIVPKDNVDTVFKALKKVTKEGIALDIQENGYEAIIKRELSNHECYYTGCVDDAVKSLKRYGISREQIIAVFNGRSLTI